MSSLVFSLREDLGRLAYDELRRNGLKAEQVRILDELTRLGSAEASGNPGMLDGFKTEAAQGRVLLEVQVDEGNQAAVEGLIAMISSDVRKFVIGQRKQTDAAPALED